MKMQKRRQKIEDGLREDDGRMIDESLGRGKVCLRRRGGSM